MLLFQVELT